MIVVGLMSGTSADGIDAAVMRLDGAPPSLHWELLNHLHTSYTSEFQEKILAASRQPSSSSETICQLNFELGEAFAQAGITAIEAAGFQLHQVDLIGSHGQTIWHHPDKKNLSTLQIGEPAVIAERTGLPVFSNFRARDMAAGGQGAPLTAYVDAVLLRHPQKTRVAQNIGGIANLTYLPALHHSSQDVTDGVIAFDTGPGNMLIDDAVRRATQGRMAFDDCGQFAASGKIHQQLLAYLLSNPYFQLPPPKTTGREKFGAQHASEIWQAGADFALSAEDVIATLTALTAQSILAAYLNFLPAFPDEVIISGGGAYNATLMGHLTRGIGDKCQILLSDEVGLPPFAKEAAAFAVLAYESFHNRPGNLPAATGAGRRVILGDLTPGEKDCLPIFSVNAALPVNALRTDAPITEARNPRTVDIDTLDTLTMVKLINQEDQLIAVAVQQELPAIAEAIDAIADRLRAGGRLVYMGAGTSGRLGVLDASECPPSFNVPPGMVVGLIAGGENALMQSVEGAEDDREGAVRDLKFIGLCDLDCLVGMAASGATPYVQAGLARARVLGALTVSLACVHPSQIEEFADIHIHPLVGPEVIAGSTRMKAGSAQKLVLNMLSTGVMIRLGKTFSNLMVDLQMTNTKLRRRAARIIAEAVKVEEQKAEQILKTCDNEVKTAIVSSLADISPQEARQRLEKHAGIVRLALKNNP